MKVKTLLLGNMQTNCYIVSDDDHHCFIVDPGDNGKKVIKFLTGIEYGEDCLEKTNLFEDIIGNKDIKKMWATLLDEVINEDCNKIYFIDNE